MMPTKVLRTACGLACAAFVCAMFASAEDAPKQGLDNAKEELGNLIQLEIRDGRLSLVRKDWGELHKVDYPGASGPFTQAQVLFKELCLKAGEMNGHHSEYDANRKAAWAETDNTAAIATMQYDAGRDRFSFKMTEKLGAKRTLLVDDNDPDAGLFLMVDQSPLDSYTRIQQCADGTIVLLSRKGDDRVRLIGDNLDALLKSEPGRVQVIFLRAFTDLGVRLAPYKFLPTAMASATSGFGQTSAQTITAVKNELEELKSADETKRAKATTELIKLFPLAVSYIKDAAEKAEDPEVKARLAKIIAAHPGIEKILPWVKEQKLHENREYLIDLLETVPFFKASARARLTELCGKDYGDDPAEWKKP